MQTEEITKQIISYQKAAFDSSFNALVMLQEQTTQAVDNLLKQSPWIPAQSRTAILEWTNMCKKGTQEFKETADQNYAKLSEMAVSGATAFQAKEKTTKK